MAGSPGNPPHREEEQEGYEVEDEQNKKTQIRICDFCGELKALLYCRADSAKLCFSCDREVHSTNPLFAKHTRFQLCDSCDSKAATIYCLTENRIFCQNCDWDAHGGSLSSIHDRRPLEGFSGCPSVTELSSILGFEDLGEKCLMLKEDGGDDCLVGSDFSDSLLWETPSIVTLDDLIVSMDSTHNFQAMVVPPLPKNRNAACGRHKEEFLHQLRNLVKLEPNLNNDHGDADSFLEFLQPQVPENDLLCRNMVIGSKHDSDTRTSEVPNYLANSLQWHGDSSDADQISYPFDSFLVFDKSDKTSGRGSDGIGGHGNQPPYLTARENLPRVSQLTGQERDSMILRYKEKKKTRRFDKHIRYESRKARAESRTRVKGRFAKVDH